MYSGRRFVAKKVEQPPHTRVGGNVLAGGGGHIGSQSGGSVGGGNIGSVSGVNAAAAAQAMQRSGDGPAQEPSRKVTRAGSDYPQSWLVTTPTGQVV